MSELELKKIVDILKESANKLSNDTSWLISDENAAKSINEMFGEETENALEVACYFECLALLTAQFAMSTESKFPKLWDSIKVSIFGEIIFEINKYFSQYHLPIIWEQLFLDRIIQYSSGDLKILLKNIVARSFIRIKDDFALPQNSEVVLENNSRLYYMWSKEPLTVKPPKYSDWNPEESEYQEYDIIFLGKYFLVSFDMLSKIKTIIDRN